MVGRFSILLFVWCVLVVGEVKRKFPKACLAEDFFCSSVESLYPFSLRDRRVRGERNQKSLLSLFVYNGLFSEEALGHLRKKTSQTRQLREEIKDSLTLQFSFFF